MNKKWIDLVSYGLKKPVNQSVHFLFTVYDSMSCAVGCGLWTVGCGLWAVDCVLQRKG